MNSIFKVFTSHAIIQKSGLALLVFGLSIAWMANANAASAKLPAAKKTAGWPKTFSLVYCWGTMDHNDIGAWCPCADLTLYRRPGRIVDVYDCQTGTSHPAAGTWRTRQQGNKIIFDFNGLVTYEGLKQQNGTYLGIMYTPGGMFGVWEGEFVP